MSNLFENNQGLNAEIRHLEPGELVAMLPKPAEGQHYEFEILEDGRVRIVIAED